MLAQASTQTVTVNYSTADNSPASGVATAGLDYVSTSGTLTFAPSETTRTITITVNGDVIDEQDETFFINLSNPIGAGIQDPTAVGLILDNDLPGPLLVQGGAAVGGHANTLSYDAIEPLVTVAIEQWRMAGADPLWLNALQGIELQIADLSDSAVGLASQGLIVLDRDAAGYGWFVDTTPLDDSEFLDGKNTPASNHIDLLSVIAHELGHLLGYDHSDDTQDVMGESLPVGVRWLPPSESDHDASTGQVDQLLTETVPDWQPRRDDTRQGLRASARRDVNVAKPQFMVQTAEKHRNVAAIAGLKERGINSNQLMPESSDAALAAHLEDDLLELLATHAVLQKRISK